MEHQKLGGTRQSSPLEDEMTYPLTADEFLLLRESLTLDKFTNSESFLLSTLITTLISGFVIYFTGSLYKEVITNNIKQDVINISQVITLIIYSAISVGCLIGYIFSYLMKKKSKSSLSRLDEKIKKHLSI
ncbi:hypothetical protein [Flavobacterium pedocola]